MKKAIALVVLAGLSLLAYKYLLAPKGQPIGGSDYYFESTTQETDTVGIYGWTAVLSADSSRGYTAICDNANGGINTANPVYLYFGTASTTAVSPTRPNGYRLGSGQCYEIKGENHYNGVIYAIASTSTTTLLTVYK